MGRRFYSRFLLLPALLASLMLAAFLPLFPVEQANADSRVTTHTTFETDERVVALTFDVTFDRGDGATILDTLRDRGVVATFAVTGIWAENNPDLMRRIVDEGHGLMNHTWDHFSLTGEYTGSTIHDPTDPLSYSGVVSQLQRTENLVQQQVGVDMKPYVRPPYGDHSDATLTAFADAGYTDNVMWTADTFGWYGDPVDEVRQRALDAAQPGANILMHVGHGSTDGAALPDIIDSLRDRGYDFATVEDFIDGDLAGGRSQYFPETDQEIFGNFFQYWWRFGGLPILGYPISGEIEEDGLTVQYFERARLELQPDTWPARYDVHLTRLGHEMVRDRKDESPFQPVNAESDDHCTFFPQTEHTLCGGFRDYWEDFGGLAIYGYPISQEFRERNRDTGETYTVQYFERQRFEWHPGEWPERHDVLLGRIGAQAYEERDDDERNASSSAGYQSFIWGLLRDHFNLADSRLSRLMG
jgi:peptidoglycan/xylan/chitin deacetylase (PgdA/CDA1 family)